MSKIKEISIISRVSGTPEQSMTQEDEVVGSGEYSGT
jgi:hypothetical protein